MKLKNLHESRWAAAEEVTRLLAQYLRQKGITYAVPEGSLTGAYNRITLASTQPNEVGTFPRIRILVNKDLTIDVDCERTPYAQGAMMDVDAHEEDSFPKILDFIHDHGDVLT